MRMASNIRNTEFGEIIYWDEQPLAYIVRAGFAPDKTVFLTPPEFKQQIGFVVYPEDGQIKRHVHRSIERQIIGTSEVLVIRQGKCEIDIYNDTKELVITRELYVGDIVLMVSGGHGFRMLKDTTFLEVKQGPYMGVDDKECF